MEKLPGDVFPTCVGMNRNEIERVIRPFVIGRKNWLFANTPRGAHASAAMVSLIESAKANRIEPYHYLRFLFTKLPTTTRDEELKTLLPAMSHPKLPSLFESYRLLVGDKRGELTLT